MTSWRLRRPANLSVGLALKILKMTRTKTKIWIKNKNMTKTTSKIKTTRIKISRIKTSMVTTTMISFPYMKIYSSSLATTSMSAFSQVKDGGATSVLSVASQAFPFARRWLNMRWPRRLIRTP